MQQKIGADFIEVVKMPDVQQKFRNVGIEPIGDTPAEMAAFVKEEDRKWGVVIKTNNISLD